MKKEEFKKILSNIVFELKERMKPQYVKMYDGVYKLKNGGKKNNNGK